MSIRVLSEQLASQIAAGEVVERPASVVKELVENALDAGATAVNIDVRKGGRESIQVADDGDGIPAAEVETAFLRHATSKINSAAELAAIGTLGFRGEALAAIAAVSQVTVVTRTRNDPAGVRLTLDGGQKTGRETVGAPQGTVIAVDNLFYNVPARLKFLKTVTTEKRLIDEFVTKYALAYPQVRFRLTHNGRVTFQSNGTGNLRDVLVQVYGLETARELLAVGEQERVPNRDEGAQIDEGESPSRDAQKSAHINVYGYASPPNLHRANRSQITLFVNGRWIKDKNLTYAIIQAYHTLLPTGRYPLAAIFVEMPLEQVDVNVHPTKTEVRFRQPGRVFAAVQRAVRAVLVAEAPIRHVGGHFESLTRPSGWRGSTTHAFARRSNWEHGDEIDWNWMAGTEAGTAGSDQIGLNFSPASPLSPSSDAPAPAQRPALAGEKLPIMRVVGQVGASYIITEGPDGLFMIDQHAAHERIMYEQFMAAHAQKNIVSQGLMAGTAVQLSPDQADLLGDHVETLAGLGFTLEPFGPQAFMIRAIPAIVAHQDPVRVVMDIVADLERGDAPMQQKVEEKIIRRVCKTASVKAGQTLSRQEMDALIQQLEACQNPHTCPHGRPTLIYLSVAQLAKEFGRT